MFEPNAPPRLYGNGLGAAGFDTTFFGHLPKNWSNPDSRRKQMLLMNQRVSSVASERRIPPPLGGWFLFYITDYNVFRFFFLDITLKGEFKLSSIFRCL